MPFSHNNVIRLQFFNFFFIKWGVFKSFMHSCLFWHFFKWGFFFFLNLHWGHANFFFSPAKGNKPLINWSESCNMFTRSNANIKTHPATRCFCFFIVLFGNYVTYTSHKSITVSGKIKRKKKKKSFPYIFCRCVETKKFSQIGFPMRLSWVFLQRESVATLAQVSNFSNVILKTIHLPISLTHFICFPIFLRKITYGES